MKDLSNHKDFRSIDSVVKNALENYEVPLHTEDWQEFLNYARASDTSRPFRYLLYMLSSLAIVSAISYVAFLPKVSVEKKADPSGNLITHSERNIAREDLSIKPKNILRTTTRNIIHERSYQPAPGEMILTARSGKNEEINQSSPNIASVQREPTQTNIPTNEVHENAMKGKVADEGISSRVVTAQPLPFSHAVGIDCFWGSKTIFPMIVYSPRLHIMNVGEETALSLWSHFGVGFLSVSAQPRGQDGGDGGNGGGASGGGGGKGGKGGAAREAYSTVAVDVPLVAEANFGHVVEHSTHFSLGASVGLGINVRTRHAAGIILSGGLRSLMENYPLEMRFFVIGDYSDNYFGIGLYHGFGKF